jgi:outer membrane protein W
MNRGFSFLNKIRHLVKAIRSYLQMLKTFLSLIILFFLTGTSFGQFGPGNLGIAINAVYTTSAKIFLNPNASDVTARNQYNTLENIYNPSMEIRYRIFDEVIIGLNVELMNKTINTHYRNLDSIGITILEVNEGFEVIPIEITAYYLFPFSVDDFKFQMGGGIGYYYGKFIREFDTAEASVVKRKIAIGIHVSATMDYMIFEYLSARFEMKFRDIQYNVRSTYETYPDNSIELPVGDFETKVDVDGLTFILGIVYHL